MSFRLQMVDLVYSHASQSISAHGTLQKLENVLGSPYPSTISQIQN